MNLKSNFIMYSMSQLGRSILDLATLNEFIVNGSIRIPEFQRPIVWAPENVEKLLDSINEDYPIGFFLFSVRRP